MHEDGESAARRVVGSRRGPNVLEGRATMDGMPLSKTRISEVTRRDIIDLIASEGIAWSGRLRETTFLSRLYDLQDLPSNDSRFRTAERDIIQHREYNYDWEDDWVFDDGRFRLRHG